jgi:hypothetical protein
MSANIVLTFDRSFAQVSNELSCNISNTCFGMTLPLKLTPKSVVDLRRDLTTVAVIVCGAADV